MTERYWLTGSQLGIIKAMAKKSRFGGKEILSELRDIENQFIGNMDEPYKDFEIVIRRKRD